MCFAGQFMSAALTFSLGSHYRRSVWRNPFLVAVWVIGFTFITLLLLLPECELTRVFHIASETFNTANSTTPAWQEWQKLKIAGFDFSTLLTNSSDYYKWSKYGLTNHTHASATKVVGAMSGAMSFGLRFRLWVVIICSVVAAWLFEYVVVLGPFANWVRRTWPSSRPKFTF